jgi:hypothetical protein
VLGRLCDLARILLVRIIVAMLLIGSTHTTPLLPFVHCIDYDISLPTYSVKQGILAQYQ